MTHKARKKQCKEAATVSFVLRTSVLPSIPDALVLGARRLHVRRTADQIVHWDWVEEVA